MTASPASRSVARPAARPVVGVLWMVLTGLLFVCMTAVVKHVGSDIPAPESAFLRFAAGLPFIVPMLAPLVRQPPTRAQMGLFAGRGVAHTIGVSLWFYAITRLPLAEMTALNYLNPIVVTLGAALVFGERLAARRLIAVGAALVGGLVVLRPGLRAIEPGHIAMLASAVFVGTSYLFAKTLSAQLTAGVVVGMLSLTVAIGLAPAAAMVWVPPTAAQYGWFVLTAIFATSAHYTMTRAFAVAPVTVTQPVTFLQLVWSMLIGALFFGESIDAWVVVGAGIIMAAICFITWREAVTRREVTPLAPATKF